MCTSSFASQHILDTFGFALVSIALNNDDTKPHQIGIFKEIYTILIQTYNYP